MRVIVRSMSSSSSFSTSSVAVLRDMRDRRSDMPLCKREERYRPHRRHGSTCTCQLARDLTKKASAALRILPSVLMERITLAPVAGAPGVAKAVKRPDSHADALTVAATKQVLGPTAKPARLFFEDGGEIEVDAWELVQNKDTVYVTAGEDAPHVPKTSTKSDTAPAAAAPLSPLDELKQRVKQMALVAVVLHAVGFCCGHIPFFVENMRIINDTAGNSAVRKPALDPPTPLHSFLFAERCSER